MAAVRGASCMVNPACRGPPTHQRRSQQTCVLLAMQLNLLKPSPLQGGLATMSMLIATFCSTVLASILWLPALC